MYKYTFCSNNLYFFSHMITCFHENAVFWFLYDSFKFLAFAHNNLQKGIFFRLKLSDSYTHFVFSRRFYMIKELDYYSHSFFLQDRLKCDGIFVQFVQLNKYLGNASKLLQKVPLFILYFLNVT